MPKRLADELALDEPDIINFSESAKEAFFEVVIRASTLDDPPHFTYLLSFHRSGPLATNGIRGNPSRRGASADGSALR
jgi:hypothetical protein